jgi:hypothetical protein
LHSACFALRVKKTCHIYIYIYDGDDDDDEDGSESEDTTRKSSLDLIRKRQEISRNKMSLKHNNKINKKTASIEIGDFVTLMIPRKDRGHSDLNRIPGQVFAKNGGDGKHETYSIVTAYRKLS